MIDLHETTTVARSAADCFRYLADFSTCEQWDPGVYRASKRTPGAPAAGSEFDVIVSAFGRRLPMRYRLEALEADHRLVLVGTGDGVTARDTITLEVIDEARTRIDYRSQITLTGPARFLAPAAHRLFKRIGRKAVAGLAQALTIHTQAPPLGWAPYLADRTLVAAAPYFTERGYLALHDKSHSEFIDGRVVAITGATSGIGRAAAAEFARLGATVLLIGRDQQRLEDASLFVQAFSGCSAQRIKTFEADLTSVAQVQAAAETIRAAHPRLDVLVNNAGALFDERAETEDGFERTLAINLVAPFVLTESLLEPLIAAGGRVVNMSSGGMYLQPLVLDDLNFEAQTFSGTKAYARSKRGLVALTRHWARRYGDTGVHFNSLHPGWAATPGVRQSLPGFDRAMGRFLRDGRMGADTLVWLGASRAAGNENGGFWFDRAPRPIAVLPGTHVRPSQAQSLYAWLRNETGVAGHGFG